MTIQGLKWPDGWPRARSRDRGTQFCTGTSYSSRQMPSLHRSYKRLTDELNRLGAKRGSIVVSSNVNVRNDGTPIGDNNYTMKDPGVAVYFFLKGREVVMAQDMFDNPSANMTSLALAIEALRALGRHGGGTMMDRAYAGFTALPPPEGSVSKRPWWEVMKYSADEEERAMLSPGEIEARYRHLAKKAHPDSGGSATEFAELTQAKDDALADLGASD